MAAGQRTASLTRGRTLYDQISSNKRRSLFLMAAFVVVVLAVAVAFDAVVGFGPVGFALAALVAGGTTAVAYWKSDAIALAMSHARPADEVTYARLHNLVEGLCAAAGLPKPRLYVIDDDAPNAFATGRDPRHASVAVTTGMLEKLTRIELEGVLAHELSHVKNYDILLSSVAVTLVGIVVLLSDWALRFLWWGGPRHRDDTSGRKGGPIGAVALLAVPFLLLAPVAARLMHLAVNRRRESLADVTGVGLTRYPPGLISALEKLRAERTVVHSASRATAHLWIESPVARTDAEGKLAWLGRLFDTHPPLDQRIEALREL